MLCSLLERFECTVQGATFSKDPSNREANRYMRERIHGECANPRVTCVSTIDDEGAYQSADVEAINRRVMDMDRIRGSDIGRFKMVVKK